jgi:hypothetical protein
MTLACPTWHESPSSGRRRRAEVRPREMGLVDAVYDGDAVAQPSGSETRLASQSANDDIAGSCFGSATSARSR